MSKKFITGTASVTIIAIILFAYIFLRDRNNPVTNALKAVPVDAIMVFTTTDFHGFTEKLCHESNIWKVLSEIERIHDLDRNILFLDSLTANNKTIREIIQKQPVFGSVHMTGKDHIALTWYINLPSRLHYRQIREALYEINGQIEITERSYNRIKISSVHYQDGSETRELSLAVSNGILMVSMSSILLENAIRQLELPQAITESSGFTRVSNTAGKNVDANLYINFKTLPKLFSHVFDNPYRGEINGLTNIANWAELDINIKKDNYLLNGFTYTSDSANNYLNIFQEQSSRSLHAGEVLPGNTAAYLCFGISDVPTFRTRFEKYLKQSGKFNSYKNYLDRIQADYGIDIERVFSNFMEDEFGLAYTDIKNFDRSQNSLVFFKTMSKSQAEEALLGVIQPVAIAEKTPLSSYIIQVRIDSETEFPVYRMPIPSIPGKLFGDVFGGAEYEYFTFVENYLFFGNSVQALSRLIHNNVLHKTLHSDLSYREFSQNLSARSNFQFYLNLSRLPTVLSGYVTNSVQNALEKHAPTLRKIQALAVQFSADNPMIYNNLFIQFQPVFREDAHTVWESLLDTNITFKPHFVKNHTTQDNEIFIQDSRNNIYLVNSAGRVLWKLPVREKILGKVYQIDYYRNNKLQILFNTKNEIHLIDRNGNYVERYPVRLRSPATNGISLFDYDNNREYRIFVAGEDRRIYLYSKDGSIVKGWTFDKSEGQVDSEIQHFRIGNRDFIVFADRLKIYILDRRGRTRIRVDEIIPRSTKNTIILDNPPGSNSPGMAFTDTSGMVYFVSFEGNIRKLRVKEFSPDHFFDLQDLDGNGSNDLIFLDQGQLEVYKQNRSKIFSCNFGHDIDLKPVCYTFSSGNKKIGIVSRMENKIYLINNDGELYSGFPLSGNTFFSIGRFKSSGSRYNLIVGNEDNFLYNYSVQ